MLIESGVAPIEAASLSSLNPWSSLVAIPLGGWVATRYAAPNTIIVASLTVSAALGIWTALDPTALGFFGFGFALSFGAASAATLPSEVLGEASRSAGLGYYFMLHFVGTSVFPVFAGWVGDIVETAAGPLIFAGVAQAVCLLFFAAFRVAQRRNLTVDG